LNNHSKRQFRGWYGVEDAREAGALPFQLFSAGHTDGS